MSYTILKHLTKRNPYLNNDNSLTGKLEFNERWPVIDSSVDWSDFTYETLMSCYEDVLHKPFAQSFPAISPPLTDQECEIWDEDSLDRLLSRAIMPQVNDTLRCGWKVFYGGDQAPVEVARGMKNPENSDRDQIFQRSPLELEVSQTSPFWAGVKGVSSGNAQCVNCCPGYTKLATKWHSRNNPNNSEYFHPIAQVLFHGAARWNTRYGYVITQSELVVLRFSRQPASLGLESGHPTWELQPSTCGPTAETTGIPKDKPGFSAAVGASILDQRGSDLPPPQRTSIDTTKSNLGGMSIAGTDSTEIEEEYNPVEMKAIPWTNSGEGKLTVKLALWWIHMMAGAPAADVSIKSEYPPLALEGTTMHRQGVPCRTTETAELAPNGSV